MKKIIEMVDIVASDVWKEISKLSLIEKAKKLIEINNRLDNGVKLYFSQVFVNDDEQTIHPIFELNGEYKMYGREYYTAHDVNYLISASYFVETKKIYNEVFDEWDEEDIYISEPIDYYNQRDWEMLKHLAKFNEIEQEKNISEDVLNSIPVRWLGAYGDAEDYSFEESLEWELSLKDREVAAQLFSTIEEIKGRYDNPGSYLDTKQIGVLYSPRYVMDAYNDDVYSMIFGSILIPKREGIEKYHMIEYAPGIKYETYSECFLKAKAIPEGIVYRGEISEEKLSIIRRISRRKGLDFYCANL